MYEVILQKVKTDDIVIGKYKSQAEAEKAIQENKDQQEIYYVGEDMICDSFLIRYSNK